ncbi:MAG TPA: hypothetical protein PKM58_08345, partial [Pyrinomonadaceae bacterium]|nr:hypothetical protein [Pyrinomonadaceae bacterium]
MRRRLAKALTCVLILANMAFAQSAFLIVNASIVDGSGTAAYAGSVRIKDGKIVKIGKLKPKRGETVIDAGGKVLAPGFIDIHNHSEEGLLDEGAATNQLSQG